MELIAAIGAQNGGAHGAFFTAHLLEGGKGCGAGEEVFLHDRGAFGGKERAGKAGETAFGYGEGQHGVVDRMLFKFIYSGCCAGAHLIQGKNGGGKRKTATEVFAESLRILRRLFCL